MTLAVDELLRRHAARLDDAAPAIDLDEVFAHDDPALLIGRDEPQRRRWMVAAAVVALVAAGAVALGWNAQNSDRTTPATSPQISTVGSAPESVATTEPVEPATSAAPTTAPTTGAPTTAPPTTQVPTSVPAGPTVADVRRHQIDKLGQLPGFTATARFESTAEGAVEPVEPRTGTVTLLADGSFYADTGPDTWGSYEPATGTARGAYIGPDGNLAYDEIVGQHDNHLAVGILVGHDPTALVVSSSGPFETPGFSEVVAETTFDGRPAWEIATTIAAVQPRPQPGIGTDPVPPLQRTVQIVDQATGLVVHDTTTNTLGTVSTRTSTLTDVRIVEELPPEFPGSIPDGVPVNRSGDPTQAPISVDAAVEAFGRPLPLPPIPDGARVVYARSELLLSEDPEADRLISHNVIVMHANSFVAPVVQISAVSLPPGMPLPDGYIVEDGAFLCPASEAGDGCLVHAAADTAGVADTETIEITDGALAGRLAMAHAGGANVLDGAFSILVSGGDDATTSELLNSFVMAG